MKKFNYANIDDVATLKKIIKKKKYTSHCDAKSPSNCKNNCTSFEDKECLKKILEINEGNIINAYKQYRRDIPTVSISEIKKKAYLSLWEKSKTRDEMLSEIKKITSTTLCPYCNINSSNDTIEHILPKSIYPEYSIFSKNLIPCCSKCNNLKRDKLKNEKNWKFATYNFYEDNIPNKDWLKAKIEVLNSAPSIYFSISEEADDLFRNHITTLKLLERYQLDSNSIFAEVQSLAKDQLCKNDFITLCTQMYNAKCKTHGYNNHAALIYKAMSQSKEYLDYLFGK